MPKKNAFSDLLGSKDSRLRQPDTINYEGAPAYSGSPADNVLALLMTGSVKPYFYADARGFTRDAADFLKVFPDDQTLAKVVVYAREAGYQREMPILALVEISRRNPALFHQIYPRILRNPKDWQKFLDICRSGVIRNGVGRTIKRAAISAIREMPVYHAIKYPTAVTDMIRLDRPTCSVNPVISKYLMDNDRNVSEQTLALARLEDNPDDARCAALIREARLPYEVVTGAVKKPGPEAWKALFEVAPMVNMVANLRKFYTEGVFNDSNAVDTCVSRLTDPEAIRKSWLLPYKVYLAWKHFPGGEPIRGALERAITLSLAAVPFLDERVAICPDVSGSMMCESVTKNSDLSSAELAGLLTGMILGRTSRESRLVLPFESTVDYDLARKIEPVFAEGGVLGLAQLFESINGGGTSLAAPIEMLIRNRVEVDRIIAITDNEAWVGDVIKAAETYLHRNPNTQIYLLTVAPYGKYPLPTDHPNIHYVFGWSDAVLRYILGKNPAQQWAEVEAVQI